MKKLQESDLLDIAAYERVRDERLTSVIQTKKRRRLAVGPLVTIVFENRETLRSQIQEIMRAERLVEPEAVRGELDAYNELIPGDDELSGTIFIEIEETKGLRGMLDRFIGLDEPGRVILTLEGGQAIPAVFETGHSREDRISAVHFVRFRLDEQARKALMRENGKIQVEIRHPGYEAVVQIPESTRRALAEDFAPV